MSLESLRADYRLAALDERNCETNPIVQFERWMRDAQNAHLKEPNAMTLATATRDGRPSSRIVLLKEVSDLGFVFYTNYGSRKAQECETNPFVSLTFYWAELERQVRVEGLVRQVRREQSEAYFGKRPRGSQLGAWVSHQSRVLSGRDELEAKLEQIEAEFANGEVPAPPFWGGFFVVPESVEFWQGRPSRLHDRLLYRRKGEEKWAIQRLWP